MNIALTALQANMLRRIALDECTPRNGAEPTCPHDTITWAANVIESAADKGVFSTLLTRGLVWHNKFRDPADNVVGLTDAGFIAYRAL